MPDTTITTNNHLHHLSEWLAMLVGSVAAGQYLVTVPGDSTW